MRAGTSIESARLYAASAVRVALRAGGSFARLGAHEERIVFVFGSPRSGTTFLGGALGEPAGFVDLGEVLPLKAIVPDLYAGDTRAAAQRIRTVLERVRLLAFARGLRGVEQTPEIAFVADAAALAYPQSRRIHLVRDGRDVVCSLLERGWLSAGRTGEIDDTGRSLGVPARFWVEPDRTEEFERGSDATRAAWAWRRYASAARGAESEMLELRYEDVAADPARAAETIGSYLGIEPTLLSGPLSRVHSRSVGRYRRDLSAEQLREVEQEAGALLSELGYR